MKYKGILKTISLIILLLVFLNLFASVVRHVSVGGQRLGILTSPINEFILFPKTVKNIIDNIKAPATFIEVDPEFEEINNLNYDLFAINCFYDRKEPKWAIHLYNLKNDSVLHKWYLKKEPFDGTDKRLFSNSIPRNCILLENRSLIVACNETRNLYRLDENSNIIWHNTDKKFHHALNVANDGNIWISSSDNGFTKSQMNGVVIYVDDFVTKIDVETGEILFDKSISQILIENGYINFVHGFGNKKLSDEGAQRDLFHLNDIEPAPFDGDYWDKGDLFLSLRHRSLIIQYRPQTNKIIRLLYGPFLNQHDVDIFSDSQISLFNNNVANLSSTQLSPKMGEIVPNTELKNSEVLVYNFNDSTYHPLMKQQFESENIFTHYEGLHTLLSTGDLFIESQNDGKIFIFNDKEILLRKYPSKPIDEMVETPHWIRIYENVNF